MTNIKKNDYNHMGLLIPTRIPTELLVKIPSLRTLATLPRAFSFTFQNTAECKVSATVRSSKPLNVSTFFFSVNPFFMSKIKTQELIAYNTSQHLQSFHKEQKCLFFFFLSVQFFFFHFSLQNNSGSHRVHAQREIQQHVNCD